MNKKNALCGMLIGVVLAAFSGVTNAEVIAYRFTLGPLVSGPTDNIVVSAGTNVYLSFDTADIWATGSNATFALMMWRVLDARTKIGKLKIADAVGPNDNTVGIQQWLPDPDLFIAEINTNIGGKIYFDLRSSNQYGNRALFPYFGYTDPPVPLGYVSIGELDNDFVTITNPGQYALRGRVTRWVGCDYRVEAKQPYRCPK